MLLLLTLSCGYKNLDAGASVEGTPTQVTNMRALINAEKAFDAEFDEYVAAAPAPVTPDQVDGSTRAWTMPEDFSRLGWAPDGDVTGAYWVELAPDGSGGTVHSVDWHKGARVHCAQEFTTVRDQQPLTCTIQ